MLFLGDLTFMVELLVIGFAMMLLIWGYRHDGVGTMAARITGYVIGVIAVLSFFCTGYYYMKYWAEGYFKAPTLMSRAYQAPARSRYRQQYNQQRQRLMAPRPRGQAQQQRSPMRLVAPAKPAKKK